MKLFKMSLVAAAVLTLNGCFFEGDDGATGPAGPQGSPGPVGEAGATSLVAQTELAVGDLNCANGGTQIDSGVDANADGVLDAGEVSETSYVCAPALNTVSAANGALRNNVGSPWYTALERQVKNNIDNYFDGVAGANLGMTTAQYQTASKTERDALIQQLKGSAKNVILFVGDGMGISTVTAARILEGQMNGMTYRGAASGEENLLSFDAFPFAGLSKTYNVDAQTPDSAGTMTAMATGVKTDVGTIGLDEDVARGDCTTIAGNELVTALELAEIAGKSTGIVSTARITHATPAALYAKSPDRNYEDVSDVTNDNCFTDSTKTTYIDGFEDIASQLVNFETNLETRFSGVDVDGIDVVFGGGRRHFLPKDAAFNSTDAVSAVEGDRTDSRDLTAEWTTQYGAGTYIMDKTGFDAINPELVSAPILGLFNESHLQYHADLANDIAGEPSLSEMTEKAIHILDNNSDGFFLMVESGRIDHAHHAGNAYGALIDTIELAKAVDRADALTSDEDTLIIVTADHGHVMTIGGYPKRGNPILGHVVSVGADEPALAADGLPHTTITYTNGIGYLTGFDPQETNSDVSYGARGTSNVNGRVDTSEIDTTVPGYHQEALIPLSSETHSGEDVGIFAKGPGAVFVAGTNEQNMIFHIMNFAANLEGSADAKL